MRGLISVAAGLALLVTLSACAEDPAAPEEPIITSLSCADAEAPGGFVACTLELLQPAGFKVQLTSRDCRAHGNVFRITAPVVDTLFKDGCYSAVGRDIEHVGPFPAGTSISAEVIAPMLNHPPALRVTGSYPEWTLTFEDGEDDDFNDLVMVLTALPQAPS